MNFFKCILIAICIFTLSGCAVVTKQESIKKDSWDSLFDNKELISVNTNFDDNNLTKVVR